MSWFSRLLGLLRRSNPEPDTPETPAEPIDVSAYPPTETGSPDPHMGGTPTAPNDTVDVAVTSAAQPLEQPHEPRAATLADDAAISTAGREAAAASRPRKRVTSRAAPKQVSRPRRPSAETISPAHDEVRLALDFGTSSTLIAVKIGSAAPRLLPLEGGRPDLPSYVAKLPDGRTVFGQEAVNAGSHVHSVKLKLRDNPHIPELGCSADEAAHMLIDEAIKRALSSLRAEGALSSDLHSLVVAMNVGCTPAFNLEQRLRLRDICLDVGLNVRLVNLVEEPVAAAFEIGLSGAAPYGRTMIVDVGGGTLDVAVLVVGAGGSGFVLHATRGIELGGDKFTDLIVTRLTEELASKRSVQVGDLSLTDQEETALWNRAEDAKLALSTRSTAVVALPGGHEVTLDRTWFVAAAKPLLDRITGFVDGVYRQARLTLDRGGESDPDPGGVTVILRDNGTFVRVHDLRLGEDGRKHLDVVCLVGGASQMPELLARFDRQLPDQMFDPAIVGIDAVQAVALGLGRHQPLDRVELRRPNWQVVALVRSAAQEVLEVEMYKPYEAIFHMDAFGPTSSYTYTATLPSGSEWAAVSLEFRPIAREEGVRWEERLLPAGSESLTLALDLFGRVRLMVNNVNIYPDLRSPFAVIDWLPRKSPKPGREFCMHRARRGQCDYITCDYHASGGMRMDED